MKSAIALVLLTVACTAADNLSGEYVLRMPEVASGLLLRDDGTFEYVFTYGAADYTAKGTWRSEAGLVILDSSGKEEQPIRLVKAGAVKAASELRVHVQGANGRGVANIDVVLMAAGDKRRSRTDGDGLAVLGPSSEAKEIMIHVPVYEIEAGPFPVETNNEFWFEINGEAITQVRFRNERLRIMDGGLEMRYWKTEKPLSYRKR